MTVSKIAAAGSVGVILGFVAGWIAAPSSNEKVELPDDPGPPAVAAEGVMQHDQRRTLTRNPVDLLACPDSA